MKTKMRLIASLAGVAIVTLMASSAVASESGFCDSEEEVCGPPPPPPQPTLPGAGGVSGNFQVSTGTIQNSHQLQGSYSNGTYVINGGGAAHNANPDGSVTLGQPANYLTLAPSMTPTPTLTVTAVAQTPQDPVFTDFGLIARGGLLQSYVVDIHANNQQAANALSALLGTSGAVATVSGAWSLTADGFSWGSVSASTGVNELDPSLGGSFGESCSLVNYGGSPSGCGAGTYALDLNFVSASVYQNGNPLDFISMITLQASANAGPAGLGYYTGTMTAMIDPQINFNINLSDYSVTTGAYNPNILIDPNAGTGGVPEPAAWALMLVGFGGLGAVLRRRRARTVFAAAA
jgi:hypothetical protein